MKRDILYIVYVLLSKVLSSCTDLCSAMCVCVYVCMCRTIHTVRMSWRPAKEHDGEETERTELFHSELCEFEIDL